MIKQLVFILKPSRKFTQKYVEKICFYQKPSPNDQFIIIYYQILNHR